MTSLYINNFKVENQNTQQIDMNKTMYNNPNLLGINSTIKVGAACTDSDCENSKSCCIKYALNTNQIKWTLENMRATSHNLSFNITTQNFPAYKPTTDGSKIGTSIQLLVANGLGKLMTLTTGNGKFTQNSAPVSFGNQFTTDDNLNDIEISIDNYYTEPQNIMPGHIIGLSNDSFSFVPAQDGIQEIIVDPEYKDILSDNYLTTGTRTSTTTQFLYQTYKGGIVINNKSVPKTTAVCSAQLHATQTSNKWYTRINNLPKTIQITSGIDGLYVPDNYSDTIEKGVNTIWPSPNSYTIFSKYAKDIKDKFCYNCILKPNASTTFCVADDTSTPDKTKTAMPRLTTRSTTIRSPNQKLEDVAKWILSVPNMHGEDILGHQLFAVRKFDAFPMLTIVYLKDHTLYGALPGVSQGKSVLPINYLLQNTSAVNIYTSKTYKFNTTNNNTTYNIPDNIDSVYVVMVNSVAFKWQYYGSKTNTNNSWELLYLPPNPNTMKAHSIQTNDLVIDKTPLGNDVQDYYNNMNYASLTNKKYRLFRKSLREWWFSVSTTIDGTVKNNVIYKSTTDNTFYTPYNFFYDNNNTKITTTLKWVYGADANKFIPNAVTNNPVPTDEFVTTSLFKFDKVTSS